MYMWARLYTYVRTKYKLITVPSTQILFYFEIKIILLQLFIY